MEQRGVLNHPVTRVGKLVRPRQRERLFNAEALCFRHLGGDNNELPPKQGPIERQLKT
jgi:hypothetical protein